MSYPELYSDERVVLQAQNVKVKSVSFEVVLTTRRLVLIDSKKNSIPPQEINLATLKDVESGENAIRDPTITISIITISGNTRQMVLTFSKTSGGERRRECDDWVRALRQNVTSTVYHPVTQVPAPKETEPAPAAQPPAAHYPETEHPPPVPHRIEITNTPPPKKRIEIARPMKKIVEPVPAMPVPVETTSLPTGTFCNRCGNRVPPESAFCNRCGTPVVQEADAAGEAPATDTAAMQQPAPAVPQVQVGPSPIYPTVTDKKDRPIEEVIHSIEPLIEDSVPRTAPAPLVPAKQVYYTVQAEAPEPAAPATPAPAADAAPETGANPMEVQWPVLPKSGIPDPSSPPPAQPSAPGPGMPPPTAAPRKISFTLIAVLALVVIAIIAGVFLFTQNPQGTPSVTPTPAIAVPETTLPPTTVPVVVTTAPPAATTPQPTPVAAQVPSSGVWVKIDSEGKYSGSVGTPGRLRDVAGSGVQLYQIPTTDGPVVASIQKSDGSSLELSVDVYKDGSLMKHATTTAPKGIVEFQASVKTVAAAATATP